ncbi:MAG: FmdB family zinc ribbon protein [Bacillota bacterium]
MALLDFRCKSCGEKFFELISSSSKDSIKCPKCSSKDIQQVYEGKSIFSHTSKNSMHSHSPKGG